ncbi:unnamed protein product [Gulo gulo]|uniref:Uncharacterized protein n=1 Tax=Gulo gulo TaxID=48420 RepID=A0A9X9LEJ0_GULGU|nr:unnamed protein product [Gulo gulo]
MEWLVSDTCEADFSCLEGPELCGPSLYPAAVVFPPGTRRPEWSCAGTSPLLGGVGRKWPARPRLRSGHRSAHFPVERPLEGSEPPGLAMYGVEARVH